MSVGLQAITAHMAHYLSDQGLLAMTAWPDWECMTPPKRAVVVVALKGCQAGPAGFQDYLGERYNEESGVWEELYGRRSKLTFSLELYASVQRGEGLLQTAFDELAQALNTSAPEGLIVQELSCKETSYDQKARLLRRSAQVVCTAYLYAVAQPDGMFLDFELRGGVKL